MSFLPTTYKPDHWNYEVKKPLIELLNKTACLKL
ncbi:unnamed protein product, partial [marine sediment metagenome]